MKTFTLDLRPLSNKFKYSLGGALYRNKPFIYYSYYVTNDVNYFKSLTDNILIERIGNDIEPLYKDISVFYSEKEYLNTLELYFNFLDILVSRVTGCVFDNIYFSCIIKDTEEELIVEFKYE